MKRTKRFLCIVLILALGLVLPLGTLAVSAADTPQTLWPTTKFTEGAKPWWIMPWWLKVQYAVKSVFQMGFKEDSLLILHEGKLVYEEYAEGYGPDEPHVAMSVTKSVLSALVGIAIREGYISGVQDKVMDYYPEAVIAPGQENKRDMTIEHLLRMRSGLPDTQDCFKAADAGLAAFETPQETVHGKSFKYNSGAGPQCLVGIVQRATGRNLYDYAKEKLFDPLGITSVTWNATDDGSNTGGFGIYMTSRDMLRFGYLYLNDGLWEGKRILPEGWAAQSQPGFNTIVTYGYLFWGNGWWGPLMGSSYEARGFYGQYITVYPSKDIVVVRTGSR